MLKLKSEWFATREELTKYVNKNDIAQEDIQAILMTSSPVGYTLFYWRYYA